MRNIRATLLAGATAIGIAALPGLASAQSSNMHTMTVQLPGGGTAQITYSGDVPPRVVVNRDPASFAGFAPLPSFFGGESPFTMIDRMSAEMDRRMAAMLREGEPVAVRLAPGSVIAPPGRGHLYSYSSTFSGNGACMRSVEVTSRSDGTPPQVVRHSSGNCPPEQAQPNTGDRSVGDQGVRAPARQPVPQAPGKRPDTLWIKDGPQPYTGLIQKTAAPPR